MVERRLNVAKFESYWKKAKVGDKVHYHEGGNEPIAINFRATVAKISAQLGSLLASPPEDLPEKAKLFLELSAEIVPQLDKALQHDQSPKALHDLFKKMLDGMFNKKGASLVSDAAYHVIIEALGVEHSCNLWPGCAYFPGILHCGRLRFVLGCWINKIQLGLCHAVKTTDEEGKGKYRAAPDVGNLNKPDHLSGGATVQSCMINTLDGSKIKTKAVPYATGSRQMLRQGDGPTVDRLFGRLDVLDKVTQLALPPVMLPLWECHPPLLAGLTRAGSHLLSFMIILAESEAPASQFGAEYQCAETSRLANSAADDFIKIADALHPVLTTKKGRFVDWMVLSPYMFLVHVIKKFFGQMCNGPLTTGMMLEDCFETCHCLSKGAISTSTAPQRWEAYNKLSLALRRRSREEQVLKGQPGSHEKREEAQYKRWRQQVPARVAALLRSIAATEYLSWCAVGGPGPETWTGYLAEYLPYVDGAVGSYTCAGEPLLRSGSYASPIWTLDGEPEADAEGEQEEEREGEGEQPELRAQDTTHTDQLELRETAEEQEARLGPGEELFGGGEAPTTGGDVCEMPRAGLNGEEHEYEATEEAVLAAAREHAVDGAHDGAPPDNMDVDPEDGEDDACSADSPEAVLDAACADGLRLPAVDRLTKMKKGVLKRLCGRSGLRLPGLTKIAKIKNKEGGKAKLVRAMLTMARLEDAEIGAWAAWARQHIATRSK